MYDPRPPRAVSAASSAAIVAGLVAVLVYGLGIDPPVAERPDPLLSISLTPSPKPTPTPRAERPNERKAAPKDEAGERNLKNKATAIVAPPVTPLIVVPPVTAAPTPDAGSAAQTGAAELPGPGRGAGNRGDGLGGGGTGGDGDGSGGGFAVVGPRRIQGRLSFADLPDHIMPGGGEATVRVVYAVLPNGRVEDCEIERTGGIAELDALTCRLVQQRFRFRPARDANGRPVRALVGESHTWVVRPPPPQRRR